MCLSDSDNTDERSSSLHSDKYPIEELQMKIHDIINEAPIPTGLIGRTLGALLKPHAEKAAAKVVGSLGHDVKDAGGIANAYKNFGKTIAKPIGATANIAGKAGMVLKFFGLYQMFRDYNQAVKQAEDNLKSGKWTQDQYNNDIKQQKAILVAQLVIALPGFLLLKISTSWSLWTIGLKYSQNPLAKAIGVTMAAMAVNAQAALIQLLRTDTAVNLYAEFIAGTFIGDLSQEVYDKVAGLIKTAENKATGKPDTATPTADKDASADKDATSTSSTATPSLSGTSNAPSNPDQDLMAKYKGIK